MKNKLAEELDMAHEGPCANDGRFDNKLGGLELAARSLHCRDKQNVILGLRQAFYVASKSTKS